jgi:hypothetical protein
MVINSFICTSMSFGYVEDGTSGDPEIDGTISRINLILIFFCDIICHSRKIFYF